VTVEIPLSRGLVAVVDDQDAGRILAAGRWHAYPKRSTHYGKRNVWTAGRCASVWMHRFITGFPVTDHINGDGLDNRRCNLRPASVAQNNRNAGLRRDNTSGFKGVHPYRDGVRWVAAIRANGGTRHLGLFADPIEAARTYDEAARHHFGEFARLTSPQEQS
jgi:hypothetical protein